MALQQGVSDRSLDKWPAKLSPCRKVLGSAPLCFPTGTSAKWRCQTVLCRQRPLSPHIRVAVETSVRIGGLERFQRALKTTPMDFTKCHIWAITESQFRIFVSFTYSLSEFGEIRAFVRERVCVLCSCAFLLLLVPFVLSPPRPKVLSFPKSPFVYFYRGHLWCKLSLHRDLTKAATSTWMVFKTRSTENLTNILIVSCLRFTRWSKQSSWDN